ncbi:MAG: YceI family protein [Actinomycetota bacterium]|nr:YceI family protein [Actinomycetota bacterium]
MNRTTELEDRTPGRARRPLVIIAVLAVVAVAAVAAVYVAFFTDDAPERLTLADDPATTAPATGGGGNTATTAASGADLVGTWRVVSGSEAGYRVREKLAALPAQSDAVGRSPAVTGTVRVDRTGGSLVATEANFEVDLTQLRSDESRRDNRLRTDGLQTNQFPRATFVSTRPIQLPPQITSGQVVRDIPAEGDLTVHGVTRRVTLPLEVRVSGNRGELAGSHTFPMSDFNINPPNIAGFVTVEPEATLEFKLVLEKA